MSMTKPMTANEFAKYASTFHGERFQEFNAMLAFMEQTVTERCARQLEGNVVEGDDLNPTQIAFNGIWRYEAKKMREAH